MSFAVLLLLFFESTSGRRLVPSVVSEKAGFVLESWRSHVTFYFWMHERVNWIGEPFLEIGADSSF